MSFQGPGGGISGTSNQFAVGYSQGAGYANVAGNANAYVPQAGYANQSAATAANIQSAQGVNGTNWAWSGQGGTPAWLWGGNVGSQYAVWQYGQMYVGSVGNSSYSSSAGSSGYANYAAHAQYSNQLQATAYCIGSYTGQSSGIVPTNSGYASGTTQVIYIGGVGGSFYNFATFNNYDRFLVYYNPENNTGQQWGAFNGGFYNTSDVRGKDFITDISENDAVTFIKMLRPRKFRWKKDRISKEQIGKDDGLFTGFIAQEVLEAASKTHDSFMHIINHGKLYLKKGGSTDITKVAPTAPVKHINTSNVEHANTLPTLGVTQEHMVPPLVKTVQVIINRTNDLKPRIEALKTKFNLT